MVRVDDSMLRMALFGYEHQLKGIQQKIADIQEQLGRGRLTAGTASDGTAPIPKRRVLSAVARRRIAAAQRKRWAEYKQLKAESAKPTAKRRKPVSPEVLKKRLAGLAKARAAKAARGKAATA
jgi:6-phosphogluconate dehydrogenase